MIAEVKKKAVQKVAADIRQKILDNTYPVGMALQQENIARSLGVSRTPLREALQILHAEDLIRISNTGRATVIGISADELLEKFELRTLIEVRLLERAIALMSDKDIADARALNQSLEHCSEAEWVDINYAFHAALYLPANRPVMQQTVKELYYQHQMRLSPMIRKRRNIPRSLREHEELLRWCEQQDVQSACDLLETHIMMGGYALIEQLKDQEARNT